MRPSYFAMLYLQGKGFRVIPVNPRYAGEQLLGETVYPDLAAIPLVPDMVSIFRKSEDAPAVVEEALAKGIGTIDRRGIDAVGADLLARGERL